MKASILVLLAGTTGCLQHSLSYPSTQVPVLLSRVDRIGGHTSQPAPVLFTHRASSTRSVVASSSTTREGNYDVTRTSTFASMSENYSGLASQLAGRHDRDVRLRNVRGTMWIFLFSGVAATDLTASSEGVVVEVKP